MWVRSLGQEDSPGERHVNPLQYSCLENPIDREAWWATVHRVAESDTTEVTQHTHTYIIESLCIQQKLAQHYKSNVLQKKIKITQR